MAENQQCSNDMNEAISDIEKCLEGKHSNELKALKKAFKTLQLEHKVEIMEKVQTKDVELKNKDLQIKDKEIQIKNKEIQIQAKEAQIEKIEKEIELLKIKNKDSDEVETSKSQSTQREKENENPKLESEIKASEKEQNATKIEITNKPSLKRNEEEIKPVNQPMISFKVAGALFKAHLDGLLSNGITKFFHEGNVPASYKEWFGVIHERLSGPVITEKYVLVKVKCKDTTKQYSVVSYNQNKCYDQYTHLNIFDKGWRHENTKVSILHPNSINNAIQMKKGGKNANYHEWIVDKIPKEYISEDGYFIVLCLRN